MPNKKKKGFRRSPLTPAGSKSIRKPQRPQRRKQWTAEQMDAALYSVTHDGLSGNKAADLHGVPRSTLKDRLSGRVKHGTKPGPKPYLTVEEEAELTSHLLQAADIGFGKTRRDVKCIVETYARQKSTLKGSAISDGWWNKYLKRNPEISLRCGDSTAGVRMDAINAENMKAYFDLLRQIYDEHGFESRPECIYNMDETGVPLEPRPPKVVARKGQKKVRYRTSGQKAQITVLGCANAAGQTLPPFIIFAAKQLNPLWTRNEVPGSRYGISDKGWVDQELFHIWLKEHFLTNAVAQRPLLLLLDGHSSHFEPQCIQFAKDNEIIIFCLPPHTTHECQPLDVGLFGPLKRHWQQACHSFYQKNTTQVISKYNFCQVFKDAWLNAVVPANVCAGFKKAGVYPFNPKAVPVCNKQSEDQDKDANSGHAGDDQDGRKGNDESGLGDGEDETLLGQGLGEQGDDNALGSTRLVYEHYEGGESTGDLGERSSEVHVNGSGSDLASGGNQDEGSPNVCETANGNGNENNPTFSIEEELHYATRFEEGYDIPDPKYEAWLRLNHPNVVSSNPSVTILQTTPSSSSASFSSPSSSQQHMPSISQASTKPNVPHKPPSATPCRSNQVSKSRRSPLSDLLNLPVQPNVKAKTGKARVLTSSECLCLLLEKEEEKKRVAQEKERRKQERELKKKQKEEEQKRKAEEKAHKAAEREAAKALKEATKADREAAKLAEREKKKELQKSRESGQKRQPCPVATTIRPK